MRDRDHGQDGSGQGEPEAPGRLTAAALGVGRLGERATLVQFSTAFCRPCAATRRVLADVAAMVGGVAHVEIDAESRLGLVRGLGITATPTVLVLDAAGREVRRAAGQPRRADVIAALGAAIDAERPAGDGGGAAG
ncbi:TlpA family protein disulfide reductase [Streptomyces marincola]|uniref:Thiol reductase thioredoxin n=1 Tax=Streptomyces marincola TaxID=2878388 RepID=A0A1W7D4P2_9ACTN|nr:thioredoxin family protein [Streptomyces marincola]ARQ72041.1 thiol reductase thioredoxin [Streptomyces marincola]